MFIEFTNRRDEVVSLNVSQIHFVTSDSKGAVIFDLVGMDYKLKESYEDFMARLYALLSSE